MFTHIELRNFKCFSILRLPLCPLTLLSGANASGKSSVMQALGLLHQTMREHEWSSRLMLNGNAVRLGSVADVIDQVHGRRTCGVALRDDETTYQWEFTGERSEMSMEVTRVSVGDVETLELQELHKLLPTTIPTNDFFHLTDRLSDLTYLTAERLGPREAYSLEDPQITPVVGPRGEHTASVLYSGGDARVLEELAVPDVTPTRLRQVEARMGRFFPGCELRVEKVPQANAVTLGLRTSSEVEFHRPVHTGFGLTQVLPIVVAALFAKQNGIVMIENPEVHLHPAGQVAMGEFLAEVASVGVQVILETHSDHVLNGVRRAVKNGTLLPDAAALHFFRFRGGGEQAGAAQVQSPTVDGNGNIDTWPEGFFDQFDKDMNYFAGWC